MKNISIIIILLFLIFAFALSGCEKTDNASNSAVPAGDDDDGDDDDDTTPSDDDTTPPQPDPVKYSMDLNFELRGKAHVDMTVTGDKVEAIFTALDGYDIIGKNTQLSGKGGFHHFDGGLRMYAFKISGPPVTSGPCASEKINYSVTLMAKGDNGYLSGGFVAYCGENVFEGTPARVYRVTGIQNPAQ